MPIELDITNVSSARLKVVGVGGAGGNAVRTMISRGLEHVEFVAANTDNQALMRNPAPVKLQLGTDTTRGLGAGANPEVGRLAVEESIGEVRDALAGADMVFVTAGMGGGTGTGAAPAIAREARSMGSLVVGIVTRPFSFENKKRSAVAEQGISELREHVDALIVIPNDRILSVVDASVPFKQALERADEVLYNATKGIADIILHEGIINVDFADVVTVMRDQGDALMGIGVATGDHRALEAAQNALNSPILEGMQIFGAKGLLVNITGGSSLTMHEVNEAISCVQQAAGDDANLIHGVVIDEMMDDAISVTVVATGFTSATSTTTVRVDIAPAVVQTQPSAGRPAAPSEPPAASTPVASAPVVVPASELLRAKGSVDRSDLELPAIWRRNDGRRPSATVLSSTPVPEEPATAQPAASAPRSGPTITIRRANDAQEPSASVPSSVQMNPDVTDTSDVQETFLRPRKVASGRGGSSQPAFLRKIMD